MRAQPRQLEGHRGDALDLVGFVDLRIDGALLSVAEVDDLLGLAEIDAAGQLAHDHDVEAVDQLALQRRGVGERGITDRGAQIGEQLEVLAQPQQPGLGPLLVRNAIPFGAADGAEHHRVGLKRASHGRVRDRLAMGIVGRAADEVGLGLDGDAALAVDPSDDALDFGHHLRPDAVARQQQDIENGHGSGSPLC